MVKAARAVDAPPPQHHPQSGGNKARILSSNKKVMQKNARHISGVQRNGAHEKRPSMAAQYISSTTEEPPTIANSADRSNNMNNQSELMNV